MDVGGHDSMIRAVAIVIGAAVMLLAFSWTACPAAGMGSCVGF